MDITQASIFLAGSILTGLGFIMVGIVILVLNNLFSKFWKPVKFFTPDSFTMFGGEHGPRFIDQPIVDEPKMDKKDLIKQDKVL